jgi:uncharacterized membrane protein YheB (UPF0754 family)
VKGLKEASANKYFYVHNGMTIRNLNELAVALDLMDKKIFEFHVNKNKNDFSNWVDEVIKEEGLAKELINIKSKTASAERIHQYIDKITKKEKPIHFLRHPVLEFVYGLVVGLVLGMFVKSFI